MRQQISSSLTVIYKALVIFMMLFGLVVFFASTYEILGNDFSGVPGFTFVMIFIAIAAFNIFWTWRYKDIEVDETNLYITKNNIINLESISVPLSTLLEARQSFFQRGNMESVTLKFIAPTEFGSKIVFIPKWRFFALTKHPIVDELNSMARNVRMSS